MTNRRKRLRELIEADDVVVAPGAYDAVSAALIESCGFPVVHATGAGISCALGYPDVGLLTMSEVLSQVERMTDVTSVPLIADIDTGYGNQLNVVRAVRAFERAGVAGFHLEDQVFPKKCGLLAGREVVPVAEMCAKLQAALDARLDPNLVVIARTDARDVLGLEAVIERGNAFHEVGADMIFVYGAHSAEELSRIAAEVPGPLMTHVSRGSSFSELTTRDIGELGYDLVIHALSPIEVGMHAMKGFLRELASTGSDAGYREAMMTYEELYGLVQLPTWLATEQQYAATKERALS